MAIDTHMYVTSPPFVAFPNLAQVIALDAHSSASTTRPAVSLIASAPPVSQWVLAAAWMPKNDIIVVGLSDNSMQQYALRDNQVSHRAAPVPVCC